jgi:LPPG:FO 2-phospho-L-lactate transferase
MKVTVLCGGVGAARFLRGLMRVMPPTDITAVVNTGDDTEMHGLTICPDLDTITYTLAEATDVERGWGLANETWTSLKALDRFTPVRPTGSTAADTWFGLGDQDLATHMYRTHRLSEGATPTQIAGEIARAWDLELTMLPMSDHPVRTMVTVEALGEISFQEYFVRHRHSVPVTSLRFAGADAAIVPAAVLHAIDSADVIVIAPSNPLVSIGPLRALPALEAALRARRDDVVAISPIVGGKALKGPADRLLVELGYRADQASIATIYRDVAATLIIDTVDADEAAYVAAAGVRPLITDTVMSDLPRAENVARTALAAAGSTKI